MSKTVKVLSGVLVAGLAALLFVEWMLRAPVAPPQRPQSVPSDAVWLGLNKGEWFQCHLASGARNVVTCTIYNDVQGDRVSSGEYQWKSDRHQVLTAMPQLKSFDGRVILADGGSLVPIGKHIFYLSGSDTWTRDYSSNQ
jgi:hypothetical protein